MYGFQAITANDGWAMALMGVSIVFSGLVLLSLAISQIHNVFNLFDKRKAKKEEAAKKAAAQKTKTKKETKEDKRMPYLNLPKDIAKAGSLFAPLIKPNDKPFLLTDLLKAAEKEDFPHPHLTINYLRDAKMLIPTGDGFFVWQSPTT
ncbi:OadG family protein [Desulfococcaceae bacterium HSG9]|nr:OadG family protein [Desulfococcaceae bacterium HSG9]